MADIYNLRHVHELTAVGITVGSPTAKPRGNNRVRKTEVDRVIRSAKQAGASGIVVDPTTGKITVLLDRNEAAKAAEGNELDQWMEKHARKVQGS